MAWDPRDDAWFAGFTDGEACFAVSSAGRNEKGGLPRTAVRFVIKLRADDMDVLDELRAAFGGLVYWHQRDDQNPQYHWTVDKKQDLLRLVAYFDRFQLRAKKARDYVIWRRAVMVYCATSRTNPELAVLAAELRATRRFDMDAPDPVAPFEVQMALEIE